ncbi:MAG TPA: metallophosphoesterase [bacterium]|nr:metallophosphoesterase [bacterium]
MQKKLTGLLLAACVLFSTTALAQLGYSIKEIKQPTFGQPEFILPGGSFEISLETPEAGRASAVELYAFDTGLPAATITIDVALSQGMNAVPVSPPASVAAGMYDLCVDFTSGKTPTRDCQKHSVVVVASFDAPFTVAHITDYHVGDPRAEKQFPGMDITKVRLAALDAANKLKPAFVLITGDVNAYTESYEWSYPSSAKELIDHLKVPMVVIPGNHDFYSWSGDDGKITIDGRDFWQRYFGPRHRVLDYGKFRFICMDTYEWPASARNDNKAYNLKSGNSHTYNGTLSKDEYVWMRTALDGAGDRTPILVAHHGPRQFEMLAQQWCKECLSQSKIMSIIKKYNVPLFIYGHIHSSTDVTEGKSRFISTTSTGSDTGAKELWSIREFDFNPDLTFDTRLIKLFDTPPMKK